MRTESIALALILVAAPLGVAANGLTASPGTLDGMRWQTRMEVETTSLHPGWSRFGLDTSASLQSARLFSDYRLDALRFGQTGGLRLTSGLLLSQRSGSSAADADSRTAWPYLGVGYSAGSVRGDWGFSADIGMAAQSLGAAVRLGRVLGGSFSVGDAVRDLRLQPVVRLGVNYSF